MTGLRRPARARPPRAMRAARGIRPRRTGAAWLGAWLPLLVAPWLVPLLAPPEWPRWAVMWLLAFVIFCGCKWLTWRAACTRAVPCWRQLGYLLAWPGLDAPAFLAPGAREPVVAPAPAEWLFALGKLAAGFGVLYGLVPFVPAADPYLVGWVGMIGVVLVLPDSAISASSWPPRSSRSGSTGGTNSPACRACTGRCTGSTAATSCSRSWRSG